jgi:hypothetical protein
MYLNNYTVDYRVYFIAVRNVISCSYMYIYMQAPPANTKKAFTDERHDMQYR